MEDNVEYSKKNNMEIKDTNDESHIDNLNIDSSVDDQFRNKIIPDQFNKYIAYFDLKLFGLENKLISFNNAHCIFLAKSKDEAMYRSAHEMMSTCLLEGMPVYSLTFVSIEES